MGQRHLGRPADLKTRTRREEKPPRNMHMHENKPGTTTHRATKLASERREEKQKGASRHKRILGQSPLIPQKCIRRLLRTGTGR